MEGVPKVGRRSPGEEASLLDEILGKIAHALDLLCEMLRIYQSMRIANLRIIPQWDPAEIMQILNPEVRRGEWVCLRGEK